MAYETSTASAKPVAPLLIFICAQAINIVAHTRFNAKFCHIFSLLQTAISMTLAIEEKTVDAANSISGV